MQMLPPPPSRCHYPCRHYRCHYAYYVLRTTYYVPRTTYHVLRTTYYVPRTTYHVLRILRITYYVYDTYYVYCMYYVLLRTTTYYYVLLRTILRTKLRATTATRTTIYIYIYTYVSCSSWIVRWRQVLPRAPHQRRLHGGCCRTLSLILEEGLPKWIAHARLPRPKWWPSMIGPSGEQSR